MSTDGIAWPAVKPPVKKNKGDKHELRRFARTPTDNGIGHHFLVVARIIFCGCKLFSQQETVPRGLEK